MTFGFLVASNPPHPSLSPGSPGSQGPFHFVGHLRSLKLKTCYIKHWTAWGAKCEIESTFSMFYNFQRFQLKVKFKQRNQSLVRRNEMWGCRWRKLSPPPLALTPGLWAIFHLLLAPSISPSAPHYVSMSCSSSHFNTTLRLQTNVCYFMYFVLYSYWITTMHPGARGPLKKLGQKLKRGSQIEPYFVTPEIGHC